MQGNNRKPDEIREHYRQLPLAEYHGGEKKRISATSLHKLTEITQTEHIPAGELFALDEDPLDQLLTRTGISANDFGTFAHRIIESRFTGIPALLPEEVRKEAELMADRFLSSELGKKAAVATWRKTEYGFLTRWTLDGRAIAVSGQIDLLFELGETVYVIDYKTDRAENPELHEDQLGVYQKAAADLYKKPVETWIFYLRTGNSVKLKR
jgi:ATP-dependent helicase/nuclease subunit A